MGSAFSAYNPFSVYGQQNLKKVAYENKQIVISILFIIIFIICAYMVIIWTDSSNIKLKSAPQIPPPIYGKGPYGVGFYLPNKELLIQSIANS
jgi:hypothetical protein